METKVALREQIQFKPPVLIQIAAMIFGVVFAFSEKYTGLEMVFAVLGSPLAFAGMVRIIIALYRIVANLTAQKVYDETGACIGMIPHRGFSVIAALIGFAGFITGFIKVAQYSQVLVTILSVGLLGLEVFVFCRDVRNLLKHRKNMEAK